MEGEMKPWDEEGRAQQSSRSGAYILVKHACPRPAAAQDDGNSLAVTFTYARGPAPPGPHLALPELQRLAVWDSELKQHCGQGIRGVVCYVNSMCMYGHMCILSGRA